MSHTDKDHFFETREEAEVFADEARANRRANPIADVYVVGPFRYNGRWVVNIEVFK